MKQRRWRAGAWVMWLVLVGCGSDDAPGASGGAGGAGMSGISGQAGMPPGSAGQGGAAPGGQGGAGAGQGGDAGSSAGGQAGTGEGGESGSSGQSGQAGEGGGSGQAGQGGGGESGQAGQGGGGAAGQGVATTLAASKGGKSYPLSQAYFGLTKLSEGGFELYVEVHEGAAPGCPQQSSPTPDRTLIVSGMRPGTLTPQTKADGIATTMLDFDGTVSPVLPLKSSAATVTTLGESLCLECYGQPDPGGRFYDFSLDATLDDGVTVQGMAHATHCDSLDE